MNLQLGSTGADVKTLQTFLNIPNPDGNFGSVTQAAVESWQTKNGLAPDGIVGPNTWTAMGLTEAPEPIINTSKLNGIISPIIIAQIASIEEFEIDNILRLSHFLSQCDDESGNFTVVSENLNYSSDRLLQVFPTYFSTSNVNNYAGNPQAIANLIYSNRMGNGSESSGDGYNYRGRGYIQITGKYLYQKFSTAIGVNCVSNPDLVATKYPLASAAWFFQSNNIIPICDEGATLPVVQSVTKKVNGGLNGLNDRWIFFQKIYTALNS